MRTPDLGLMVRTKETASKSTGAMLTALSGRNGFEPLEVYSVDSRLKRDHSEVQTTYDHAQNNAASYRELTHVLSQFLSQVSPEIATTFLVSKDCSDHIRQQLAEVAGLESSWVQCDQQIHRNKLDLVRTIVSELFEPYYFYKQSLDQNPSGLFDQQLATMPLQQTKKSKFWSAKQARAKYKWLPPRENSEKSTFDATVHFIQGASGTGVHIGKGRVVTCAHVVDAREDDDLDESLIPERVGRLKVVMFPSGRVFLAQCASVNESVDGSIDVAALIIGSEVDVGSGSTSSLSSSSSSSSSSTCSSSSSTSLSLVPSLVPAQNPSPPPAATISQTPAHSGESLFCVGNPSTIDLECLSQRKIEFAPPTWHISVGKCEGYLSLGAQEALTTQLSRGRPPTRGEVRDVSCAPTVEADEGGYLLHSCWTYWGHSGAPLFDESGDVRALHCSWDDRTGMRQAQKLENLHQVVDALEQAYVPTSSQAQRNKIAKKDQKKKKKGYD